MQSRSASNTAQPTENDVYTVKLTCNDALCGSTEYTTTATHTTGGLYSANLTPTVGGTYDVLITMENAYTAAESSASTTVSSDQTLVVVNPATVPELCEVIESPVDNKVNSGDDADYKFKSKDIYGTSPDIDDDVYTVTLTCKWGSTCGDKVYTYTSSADAGTGEFLATATPTLGGEYDVLITMENAYTDSDCNVDTLVNNSLTLTVIDTTTVPSACTVVASDTAGDIVRPTGSTFSYTMQSRSSDNLEQAVTDDVYIVTLTSITAEEKVKRDAGQSYNEVIVTNTATAVSGSDG